MRRLICLLVVCLVSLTAGALGEGLEGQVYAQVATEKGTLNMRSAPDDDANVMTKLARGTVVTVLEEAGIWTKILFDGAEGYVKGSYLDLVEIEEDGYASITPESDGERIRAFKKKLHELGYLKSEEVNKKYDQALETALLKLQLLNGVTASPREVTAELQSLMDLGKIQKAMSGYLGVETDPETGLTAYIFVWDAGGMIYQKDEAIKLTVSFAAQGAGGDPGYFITVKKSLGAVTSGDTIESPFQYIWYKDSAPLNVYATVIDASGRSVTACAPFSFSIPERYR